MPHLAVPTPAITTEPPPRIVDLDTLSRADKVLIPWTPPVVIDETIITHPHVSPLDADSAGRYPTALRGGIVTDPQEIAAIRRRVEAHTQSRGAWRRVLRRIRSGR